MNASVHYIRAGAPKVYGIKFCVQRPNYQTGEIGVLKYQKLIAINCDLAEFLSVQVVNDCRMKEANECSNCFQNCQRSLIKKRITKILSGRAFGLSIKK